ncbi:bacteriocin immunity protein [Streptomyces sp. 3211]|uniref:bacteriocin immunity protein n=1 Tax=Streptomyces sp. 3211 TaxID=1964449 RepID=UPI0009A52B95|nr:bacteriocin immunity protein [Streptomyces sp. 3211]
MTREEAVRLVQLLMDGNTASEAEGDAIIEALELRLRCPHISDYIFYPGPGQHPSAEQVVERAMAYRPIAL